MPAPVPTAQMWHKAFWSMKERKRLADEYATGELEREKEKIKYASDRAGERELAGDTRAEARAAAGDSRQRSAALERLRKEYELKTDYDGVASSNDLINRTALQDREAALVDAEAQRDLERKKGFAEAQLKMQLDAERARDDDKEKKQKEAIAADYKNVMGASGLPVVGLVADAIADKKATSALQAMRALDMQREAAMDRTLLEKPELALPGFIGAEGRKTEAEIKAEALKGSMERFGPTAAPGRSRNITMPPPGTRIKLGGSKKKSRLEELDEQYSIRR